MSSLVLKLDYAERIRIETVDGVIYVERNLVSRDPREIRITAPKNIVIKRVTR